MDLDQRVHLQHFRRREKVLQLRLLQRGDDEQHGIRTRDRGLKELHFVDDEILPQTRERDLFSNPREVAQVPLEKLLVREHRHAIRARRFIKPPDRDRVEILRDHSRTRRRLLHLRDQTEPIRPVIEPRREAAEILAGESRGAEQVRLGQNARDLLRFDVEDLFKTIRWHKKSRTFPTALHRDKRQLH